MSVQLDLVALALLQLLLPVGVSGKGTHPAVGLQSPHHPRRPRRIPSAPQSRCPLAAVPCRHQSFASQRSSHTFWS